MKLNYSKISVFAYASFLAMVALVYISSLVWFNVKGWFNYEDKETIFAAFLYCVMVFLSVAILVIFVLDYRRQTKHRSLMQALKTDIQTQVEETATAISQAHAKDHATFFIRQGAVYENEVTRDKLILSVEDVYFDKICYLTQTVTTLAIGTDLNKNTIIYCNIRPSSEWTKIV